VVFLCEKESSFSKDERLLMITLTVAFHSSNDTKCMTSMVNKNKRTKRKILTQKNRNNNQLDAKSKGIVGDRKENSDVVKDRIVKKFKLFY
jgi:hypothetical protein